jgi:hypothetical protein
MKYLKIYEDFQSLDDIKSKHSETRTKALSEDEFLEVFRKECKNFSFLNDQLWRCSNNSFGRFGLFFETERKGTIGTYNYKDFFDLRNDYPVPRYKSLIGSTTREGADLFGSGSNNYLVIPFDNSKLVFAGSPDLALWSRTGEKFCDSLFIMKEYEKGFRVPIEKLESIRNSSSLGRYKNLDKYGFEFFTNGNCLLLEESKISWLINEVS